MGVVAAQSLFGLGSLFGGHIRPKTDRPGLVQRAIFVRRGFIRKVRRPERKEKKERVVRAIVDEPNRVISLGESVITRPITRRLIVSLVVERMAVIMRTLA